MEKVRTAIRILVACLFLYAGIFKAFSPAESVLALRALEISDGLAEFTIYAITVVEIHIGVLLLLGLCARQAGFAAIACLGVFLCFLVYLASLASAPSCGCPDLLGLFKSNRQKAVFGIFRNTALIALMFYFVVPPASLQTATVRKEQK